MGTGSPYIVLHPENESIPLVCICFLFDDMFCFLYQDMQVRHVISQLQTCPEKRKAIISDLYKLHCEGLFLLIVLVFYIVIKCVYDWLTNVEVVLNENEELLHTMIECGMLESLVDIFSEESDPATLVCFFHSFSSSVYVSVFT